jgi:peroxiredoxin
MAALTQGMKAPEFTVPTLEGKEIASADVLAHGPVLLAFFKISCPVCQYAFPYFERMYKALRARGVSLIGISQDNVNDTRDFVRRFGITFPIGIDDEKNKYRVSNSYGLTNVPTLFEIASDGSILSTSIGWMRDEVETVYSHYNDGPGLTAVPLFNPGENVAEMKIG